MRQARRLFLKPNVRRISQNTCTFHYPNISMARYSKSLNIVSTLRTSDRPHTLLPPAPKIWGIQWLERSMLQRRSYGAANTKFSKKARRFPTYSALLHPLYRSNAAPDLTRKMSWQEYFGSGWPITHLLARINRRMWQKFS
jgi:hypothetical protein